LIAYETLKAVWSYIKGRYAVLREDLSEAERNRLASTLSGLATDGLFVLSKGELEDYLPADGRSLDGTVELLKLAKFSQWLDKERANPLLIELESITLTVLGIAAEQWDVVRGSAREMLRPPAVAGAR
jgi:hypothetical protein